MNAQIRTGRFKLAWFIAGIAVLPLSVVLATLIAYSIGMLNWGFASPLASKYWSPAMAVYWLVNGFCIGFLQKAIVNHYLRVDLGRWTVYSSLGALLAGTIAYSCMSDSCLTTAFYDYGFSAELNGTIHISLLALLYLTVFSAVQWLALNRLVKGAWRWIAAHSVTIALAASVLVAGQLLPGATVFNRLSAIPLFILVITVATGLIMQRLLTSNRGATKEPIDEWAYQPAPIEPESAVERSVWDDAI
ncbi:MAG: hypothetical protein OXG53_10960 [Chloroflexi bacterium]|nr:hypothetical protein [Chloroflexota bacterium]